MPGKVIVQSIALDPDSRPAGVNHSQVILFRLVKSYLANTDFLNFKGAMDPSAKEALAKGRSGDLAICPTEHREQGQNVRRVRQIGMHWNQSGKQLPTLGREPSVGQTMTPNLALIGCGAIARAFYLPVLAKNRAKFGRIWFIDPSDRALSVALSTMPEKRAPRLADVDDEIHLAIVATPNHLHYPLACEVLSRGADVLIEKPFVIWPIEGRRLIELAAENNRLIAVNQTRRFFPASSALRQQLKERAFGSLKSIMHPEGTKLVWPFESGAGFAQGAQRTGVIMDFGVHVIDFYHYLLHPQWTLVSAIHDGFSGPEGLAEIELEADQAPVSIRLSRYHQQENVARLVFQHAEVSFNVYDPKTFFIRRTSGKAELFTAAPNGLDHRSHAEQMVLNFLIASQKREPALCDAASSLPVIELIDKIYCQARQYAATPGSV